MSRHAPDFRPARPDDADHLRGLRQPLDDRLAVVLVAPADARPRAGASLDPIGLPAHPDLPCLVLWLDEADDDDVEAHAAALIEAALHRARADGHERVVTRCDPLDRAAVRRLERHGFRPTGTPPYFELGPGHLQYVTGYQDATGSWLDLAVSLAAPDA